jgi:hypothetical protein
MIGSSARFDYYTASIEASADDVIGCLQTSFDLSSLKAVTPKNGYERAYNLVRGETVLARVQFGGNSVGTRVWANASGEQAPAFAAVVRDSFRGHNLLRADVALDYDEEGAWDSLSALAIDTADRFRLKVKHVGDFHRQEDGRTLYVGSRTSAAMQRIYEKGKQLGMSPNWVRAELELKPQNPKAKLLYGYASPEQMFMATKWTQCIWEALSGPSAAVRPAPPGTIRVKSDDDRAMEFMAKQYGNVLRRKLEAVGGDLESFGLYIAGLLDASS